ncbi:DUF1801 domain-containing protein [Salinibacterium sp. SWN167]|uniref:DUF1801 domain-containing protein n=1 Tax=Salinibacterium sp. SWN167 TaxID=2792054 RepID=UPI0018CFEDC2|nr:DUF1801 domain-containing protein [Salinibacterium sp. SWN167]MBH0083879.1 DUF1801 domain-containing protein [Salinibacterium sp. SWN167]
MVESASIPTEVAAAFDDWEEPTRDALLELRELILDTAAETHGTGAITETLKWGQPAYLTSETHSGTTVRMAPAGAKSKHDYAMYFICSTSMISDIRAQFGDTFTYDGKRALVFNVGDEIPTNELRECVRMALTYHQSENAHR